MLTIGLRTPAAREGFIFGCLLVNTAIGLWTTRRLKKANKELLELYEARSFLLSLLEKYDTPLDDFDMIALMAHSIKVSILDENDGGAHV